ncbi:fimbria/pilus outer membrane usher protein [Acinetobacter sp. dk771]|uniref:Fimbria/pilus outer membrane usher protein n=1 Tax=Acinetobacter wanghuae TaxID=2662362 RepID=A0AA91AG88_9GAMM|nr:fimbria/pilus outer membrane usher protein [Acinetobacter wanghuae]MQW93314.1 fimbria/pilus outer membrane usher protein [Acinetobacter wanghuae]
MAFNRKIFVLLNIFFVFGAHASTAPTDATIVNLWINDLNQNTDVTLLKQNEHYFIECLLLTERNINPQYLIKHDAQLEFCSVSESQIQATLNQETQSIHLTIPSHYFTGNNYGDYPIVKPERANFGGFVNYDGVYNNNDRSDNFTALVDVGVFKNYWFFKNSMFYRTDASPQMDDWVRLSTSLDIDFPERLTKLTIGDSTTLYNPMINSLRFAGLNWGTNYLERPSFVYWDTPQLKGSARLPSTIDLYMNGVSIYRQRVSPGDYVLDTGAKINYTGNAQIVVEDILGNRSVQNLPIMVTHRLLRRGLSEYNVALGKLRYNYSTDSSDYRDFFTNLYYRRGLSKSTSLGGSLTYTGDIQNIGLVWTQALPKLIVMDVEVLGSHDDRDGAHYQYGISMSKDFGLVSMGLSSKFTDRHFKYVGDELKYMSFLPKNEYFIYAGITQVPVLQNLSLNYAQRSYYPTDFGPTNEEKILNISMNRPIGRKVTLGLSYFNRFGSESDSGGTIALSYNFDVGRRAYFNYSADNTANLEYVKTSDGQVGLDYAVGANRRDDEEMFSLDSVLKTRVGDLSLQHYQSNSFTDSYLRYRGGVAYLDGKVSLTKAVDNAFAIVRVGQYQNIDILSSLNLVEKTNKNGYAFVHNIVPYVESEIVFDADQIPIEDKVAYSSKKVVALGQRGYVVNFPMQHTFAVVLHPKNSQGNRFIAGSEVYLENGDVYPITSDGSVTIYGMTAGVHQFTIKTASNVSCFLKLELHESAVKEDFQSVDAVCK